jgi:hypothetical protein
MDIAALVKLIREEVAEDEVFVPKEGRDPRRKKRLDARQALHQILWHNAALVYSRPPHTPWMGISDNGVPYHNNMYSGREGRRTYLVSGWNRPRWARRERHRNGKKEWGADRDAWAKAFVQDKSSRARMRAVKEWWNEATEALEDEGF